MPPRNYVLHEANLKQLQELRPNVAVLPWGATEAHNFHLPHGTDVMEGTYCGEQGVKLANEKGARCLLLPTVPFGNDNLQINQVATITMRTMTQHYVLRDICESLVAQGIDRLVLLNFHGGNDFKQIIRDLMLDFPIFIVQIHGYLTAKWDHFLDNNDGDHANEFETSLMLHLAPDLCGPLSTAGPGAHTPFKLDKLKPSPAVWSPRDWQALTADTGTGDPKLATAEKGRKIWEVLIAGLVPMLVQLSAAKNGDFPYLVRKR